MKNEIDYKKLESCMVELFCDKNWVMHDEEYRRRIRFLTNSGQVISEPYQEWEESWFERCGKLVSEDVRLALRLKEGLGGPPKSNHFGYILWSIALYITRYWDLIEQPDDHKQTISGAITVRVEPSSEFFFGFGGIENVPQTWGWKGKEQNYFIKMTKMCRVSLHKVNVAGVMPTPLNIETHNPLTSEQRKFFLEVIEGLHISPDKIFIDDYSKEQCVKRQLGLHFFK